MRVMDCSKEGGTRGSTEELWFEAKVQLVWVNVHLLLYFLLVVVNLPGYMDMHSTPLSWFPENRPERICQPRVFLKKCVWNSSGSACHV